MQFKDWLTAGKGHRGIDVYGDPGGTFEAYAYDSSEMPNFNGYSSGHDNPVEAMQAAVDCWVAEIEKICLL